MAELHGEKKQAVIRKLAAEFIERESNQTSLITVTDVKLSSDLKKAMVFITVLPDSKEKGVIDFLKRKRGDLREYMRSHAKMGIVPFVDILIDEGEKNRQHIDTLLGSK